MEEDDSNLMDFLRTSGQEMACRERKSWGSLGRLIFFSRNQWRRWKTFNVYCLTFRSFVGETCERRSKKTRFIIRRFFRRKRKANITVTLGRT